MTKVRDQLHIDAAGSNAVTMEIASTLSFLGVPAGGHTGFMDVIESYRSQVVQA